MGANTQASVGMKVDVSTVLDCSVEKAWSEVQKSSLHQRVIRPLIRMVALPATPLPDRWEAKRVVRCDCYLFGFVPVGTQTIFIERIDHDRHEIQSREHSPLLKRWDHRVSIEPLDIGRALYRDEIEIDAGWLTIVVWAWANWFYRHRQSKWRPLATNL
jgi:hypothetical protein